MSRRNIEIYYFCRNGVEKTQLLSGILPIKNSGFFYRLIPVFQMMLCIGPLYGISGFCRKYGSNVILLTKGLGLITSYVTIVLKALCILFNMQDIAEIQSILDENFNNYLQDERSSVLILDNVEVFYYVAMSVIIPLVTICISFPSAPMISVLSQYLKHAPTIKYTLPYPAVYQWKIPPKSLIYWIHYTVESLGNCPCICYTISVDGAFLFYIFQIIGLLRGISYRLKNLNKQKDCDSALRECIDLYETLTRCRNKIQQIYGPIILWTITTNAIVMCSLVFQITHVSALPPARLLLFCIYVFFKLSQTFAYGWIGTQLTVESENCKDVITTIDWTGNRKLKSVLLIMLPQKPLKLTACNFSTVSVDLFIKVVNTTVSYFFLLQTMELK